MTAEPIAATVLEAKTRTNTLIEAYSTEIRRGEGSILASLLPAVIAFGTLDPAKIKASSGFLGAAMFFSASYVVMFWLDLRAVEKRIAICRSARKILYSIDVRQLSTQLSKLEPGVITAADKTNLLSEYRQIEDDVKLALGVLPTSWKPLVAALSAVVGYFVGVNHAAA